MTQAQQLRVIREDGDFDLAAVLDEPEALVAAPCPGGLNRMMRTVEAVQDTLAA